MNSSPEGKRNRSNHQDKTMPEKDASLWGLAVALGLGILGGMVRLLQKWSGGKVKAADIRNAAIDLFGSAFISMIAYMLAVWWLGLHPMAAAGIGGVAGHIGTRASILALEQYIKRKLK